MSNFQVGQVVVCVNDKWPADMPAFVQAPVKGGVYTVRGVRKYRGVIGVTLAEIVNPISRYLHEEDFRGERFRPAVETDISIFTAMLTQQHERA